MQDKALYEQILGLQQPWKVKEVTLDRQVGEIVVEVECTATLWGCPQCQRRMTIHDWETRRWRHLDSCQYKTILQSKVPLVKCPEHGTITVAVPWAEKYGRFTKLFERLAIDVMLECSISGACDILRISWDEADGIKQRAVARGQARKPKQVAQRACVDEKSAGRGQNYLTIVASLDGAKPCVEYVGEGRAQDSLDAYWQQFSQEELGAVEAVAMDMWQPFIDSTLALVPQAQDCITHDPYHLVAHLNEAVNKVRKAEHRELSAQGDATLSGTRMLWLYGLENIPPQRQAQFDQIKLLNLRTSRAWALKEVFRSFWLCESRRKGESYFARWYSWAIRSRLEPVKKVARMCKKRLHQILNYFDHKITNGPIEGLNNKIQGLIKKAFGYRNPKRFVTDIFFHCGGLDLYPAP
jgi:transposase